jgi:hypothetical protein
MSEQYIQNGVASATSFFYLYTFYYKELYLPHMQEHVPQPLQITETTPTNEAITKTFERITQINEEIAKANATIASLEALPKTPASIDILNQERAQLTTLQELLANLQILKADLVEEKRVAEAKEVDAHKLKMAGLEAKYDVTKGANIAWDEVGATNGNPENGDLDPFEQGQVGRDLARLDKREEAWKKAKETL